MNNSIIEFECYNTNEKIVIKCEVKKGEIMKTKKSLEEIYSYVKVCLPIFIRPPSPNKNRINEYYDYDTCSWQYTEKDN